MVLLSDWSQERLLVSHRTMVVTHPKAATWRGNWLLESSGEALAGWNTWQWSGDCLLGFGSGLDLDREKLRFETKMHKELLCLHFIVVVFSAALLPESKATTDKLDVIALNSLFKDLNFASQLKGWKLDGSDPCGDVWTGVACSGSSVTRLTIPTLNLGGYLGQLDNLHNLAQASVSEIPYGLPPNVTHVNMACNRFIKNIPHSISFSTNLRHLNLSHNPLSGPIGDVFTQLQSLKTMDLSNNKFAGDLPKSFASLTNLTELSLENNNFTGSVIYLAELPLSYLNLEGSHFTGRIPRQFQSIQNLWFWGNRFDTVAIYPPWNFPLDSDPHEQNISSPPSSQQSAMVDYPSSETSKRKKKRLSPLGISSVVVGAAAAAICVAVFFVIHIKRSNAKKLESLDSSVSTHHSPIISPTVHSIWPQGEIHLFFRIILRIQLEEKASQDNSNFLRIQEYTVAELQLATNSFSEENLLGEGTVGPVYKAELPDGQKYRSFLFTAFAVKVINIASLSFHEEEKFMDVIQMASQLRHPNIVRLIGYCVEHDQHLVVYEYVRNLSLEDALHN
ncbi:DRT111 protein [Hibiscus syriacus]|uniref:DRT111 protein n=1 Tax=Hibiscus syriacus TaxID=106335 RepID=A0A6A3CAM2_HIBSY|nr:DRT111 protein [Hibiscus syriacus]